MIKPLLEGWKEHKTVYTSKGKPLYAIRYCEEIQHVIIDFADSTYTNLAYFIGWFITHYYGLDTGEVAQLYDLIQAVQNGTIPGFSGFDGDTDWEYFTFTIDNTGIRIISEAGQGTIYFQQLDTMNTLVELCSVLQIYIDAYKDIFSMDILAYNKDEYEPVEPAFREGRYPHYNFMMP